MRYVSYSELKQLEIENNSYSELFCNLPTTFMDKDIAPLVSIYLEYSKQKPNQDAFSRHLINLLTKVLDGADNIVYSYQTNKIRTNLYIMEIK